MDRVKLAVALLLACLGTAKAEDANRSTPVSFRTEAKVWIDPTGKPQRIQANERLPEFVRKAIAERIMGWEFEPATVDGVPKSGATYVRLDACVAQDARGDLGLAVLYLGNGPGHPEGKPTVRNSVPRYPLKAAKANKQAELDVTIEIHPDGSTSIEEISSRRKAWSATPFVSSLTDWVGAMRHLPEELDGIPVATRLVVPVIFSNEDASYPDKPTKGMSAACQAATQEKRSNQPVVLDSPFKPLKTG